jgi:hypothetical protein
MRVIILFRLLLAGFVVAGQTSAIYAQCVIFDKPAELFGRSEVVFRGTVLAKRRTGAHGSHVIVEIATFRVDQAWKGKPGRRFLVGTDRPFELGKQYLVFASGTPPSTSILCHSAELVGDAKAKLDWLSKK